MDESKNVKNVEIDKISSTKKKRKHRKWIIPLVAATLLVATPIALVYGFLYDNKTTTFVHDEEFDVNNATYYSAVDALDNTKTTKKINLNISSDIFNELLYMKFTAISDALPVEFKDIFTNLYLETSESNYNFVLDIDLKNLFKTRIKIVTTLANEIINDKEAIVFNVTDIKVGRLGGLYDLLQKYLPDFTSDEFILGLFDGIGLSFEVDMSQRKIIYYKDKIPADISSFVSNQNDLYAGIMAEFFARNLFSAKFAKSGLVGVIDLESLTTNNDFLTKEKENDVLWENYETLSEQLINDNVFVHEDVNNVYNYMLYGFEKADSTFKDKFTSEVINTLKAEPYSIVDPTTYKGVFTNETDKEEHKIVVPNQTLVEKLSANVDATKIATTHEIGRVSEDDLNLVLNSSNIIGNNFLLEKYTKVNNEYKQKINSFTITNFYGNIIKDHIKLVVDIAINGLDTYVCIDAKYLSFENYKVTYDLNEIYYGEKVASDDFKGLMFDLVEAALDNDSNFSFNKTNKTITIDFIDSINNPLVLSAINAVGKAKFSSTGESLESAGELILTAEAI